MVKLLKLKKKKWLKGYFHKHNGKEMNIRDTDGINCYHAMNSLITKANPDTNHTDSYCVSTSRSLIEDVFRKSPLT